MDFFTICIAITCMIALACIAHLKDELNKINTRLSDMKFMINAYTDRTDLVLDDNRKMIEYIEVLEKHINKED